MPSRDPKAYAQAYYQANKEKIKAQVAAWYQANKERAVENRRRHQAKSRRDPTAKFKFYARKKLERAVKEGRIAKLPCEICGSIEVEAHHNDYAKWKEVRWFCKEHHIKYHDILRNA